MSLAPPVASPCQSECVLELKHHATLTIPIHAGDWKPRKALSTPAGHLAQCPVRLQAQFVRDFNGSRWARKKSRLAILLTQGGVLFLSNVPDGERSPDPLALPPGASDLMSRRAAVGLVAARNDEILEVARVPKTWTVCIRHVGTELSLPETEATI